MTSDYRIYSFRMESSKTMQLCWLLIYLAAIFFSTSQHYTCCKLHILSSLLTDMFKCKLQVNSIKKIMWSKAMHAGMWVQCRLARESLQHNKQGYSQNKAVPLGCTDTEMPNENQSWKEKPKKYLLTLTAGLHLPTGQDYCLFWHPVIMVLISSYATCENILRVYLQSCSKSWPVKLTGSASFPPRLGEIA